MKRIFILSVILSLATTSLVVAKATTMEETRKQALDFGTSYKNSAATVITESNKKNTPGYTTDNPDQVKYYDGGNMSDDALTKTQTSEEGKLMTEGLPNRPQVSISPGDDWLSSSQAIEGNPDEVVAMLTGTYGECKPIEHTKTETEVKTCDEYEETDCIDGAKLVSVSGADTSWSFPTLQQNISWRGGSGCSKYFVNTTINIKDVSKIDVFTLNSISWDDVVRIRINGTTVFQNGDVDARRCERGTVFGSSPNTNLKPYLQNGANTIELKLGVAGMGFASAVYTLSYNNTRKCQTISTCKNIPSECALQGSKCVNMNNDNICNYRQYTYACSTTTVTSTASVECGSNIYCTGNQCTKVEEDSNQDFATSIAYLSSINQAAKDNNASKDNLKIFSGSGKSCEKDTVSYNNCCKDDGWGQDYTGASCKEEEKSLMELQSKKMCHYVGSYCSQKVPLLGKCLKTKKTYCCFNSKISRVIMEQGRAQLGKGWGSAESPDCGGFTPDELGRLQFDKMNL
ncbi:MAG: conjugal transfer protein TraN, partial [Pelagibacterales bacterium]|nr:conjugal transfer protein TraN [Pelagibacterales bacterium]